MVLDSGKFFSASVRKALMGSLVLGALGFSASTLACSTAAWDSVVGGGTGAVRYSGDCAFLPATGSAGEYVQDNIDGGATSYIASFYALTKFSGGTNANTVTVFQAEDPGTASVAVEVRADETAVLTTTAGGESSSININGTINNNGWNHYKVEWTSGGTATLTVNGGSSSTPINAGTGTLSQAQLGHIASSTPNLTALAVDQFVSLRVDDAGLTSPLCIGDASGDGEFITGGDALVAFNAQFGNPSPGQPDFNGDGNLTGGDALAIFNNQGSCP